MLKKFGIGLAFVGALMYSGVLSSVVVKSANADEKKEEKKEEKKDEKKKEEKK